jgi:hypothetical protein
MGRYLNPVDVMGRYLNPSDQGERLHDLLRIVPSGRKTVNSRTPKAIHRRLRPAQVEELVAGYQAGSTVYQLAEQFRINRETVPKLLERSGVLAGNVPSPPLGSSKPPSCTPLGCHWSALASGLGATAAPCTLPSARLVYGCGTVRAESARRDQRNAWWLCDLI